MIELSPPTRSAQHRHGKSHATKSSRSFTQSFVLTLAVVGLAVALVPSRAHAQAAPPAVAPAPMQMEPVPASPPPLSSPGNPTRLVGGHFGGAVPVLDFHSQGKGTRTPSDQLTIAVPIGITVHLSPDWVFDFETVVANNVKPAGSTVLTVDPGMVYVGGPVALGLRLKFDINNPVNVGLIPLIHKGIVDLGEVNWFIEAAFPLTLTHAAGNALLGTGATNDFSATVVLHTGFAF